MNKRFLEKYGSEHHLDEILKNPETLNYHNVGIVHNPHLQKRHIDKLLRNEKLGFDTALRSDLTDEHIDFIMNSGDHALHSGFVYNPKIQPHHIDKLVNSENYGVKEHIVGSKNSRAKLTGDHIDKLVGFSPYLRKMIADHPLLKDHHLDKLIVDPSRSVRNTAMENPNVKKHHLEKFILDMDNFHTDIEVARTKLKELEGKE